MSGKNLMTFVVRQGDQLMLVSTMDNDFGLEEYKSQAKKVLRMIGPSSPSKCIMEAGDVTFCYLIDAGVIYLTLTERQYPRYLAFEYLRELSTAFSLEFAQSIPMFNRPFAAVSFDMTMEKIRRRFMDPQSQAGAGMTRLSSNLHDIHNIMSQNIKEVIQRGEKIEQVEGRSSQMLSDSRAFKKGARNLHLMAMAKTWGPVAAVVAVILLVMYFKFK